MRLLPPAIDSLQADKTLPKTSVRKVKYLNNMVELFAPSD